MLPIAEGSDDRHHVPPVQRSALNARQHLMLDPSIERAKHDREGRRLRLLRFLYPLDAALKGADACHVVISVRGGNADQTACRARQSAPPARMQAVEWVRA